MSQLFGKELEEFNALIAPFIEHEKFKEMAKYIQHGNVDTMTHCIGVAADCFVINRKYNLGMREDVLIPAALLHDFYLYDWHEDEKWHKLHGFQHPSFASSNAMKHFKVSSEVSKCIRSHMWPLTLLNAPSSKEAWLICLVDKGVSFNETIFQRKIKRTGF